MILKLCFCKSKKSELLFSAKIYFNVENMKKIKVFFFFFIIYLFNYFELNTSYDKFMHQLHIVHFPYGL